MIKSKFDSDPDSNSEDEDEASSKDMQPSSLAQSARGYSGYHDAVLSGDEQSNESEHEQQEEEERLQEKESILLIPQEFVVWELFHHILL